MIRLALPGLMAIIMGALTLAAQAHEISFNRSTVRTDDFVTLTIALEGSFTGIDHVKLPLENLTLVAGPSSATEFRWINGETSRRRVLTYRLRPITAGPAAVGPVIVSAPNGDQLTLKRVSVEAVDPVRPESPLPGDLSLGRLPAIIAEVSKRETWVGEQIEVRWSLYGENIRGVQILELPSLDGFWVEQLDVDETTREVVTIGDELIQRQTLRHALLYPLQPGRYDIAPLIASVRVYRRDPFGDAGGWNPFSGSVSEVTRRSDPVTVDVSSPPDPTLPVGSFDLSCSGPNVPRYGPIAIDLNLSGAGNLRSVSPPRFSGELQAGVELEPLATTMKSRDGSIMMQRGWRYLFFPESDGTLAIPPLIFRFFDPATERAQTARCGGWTVPVSIANAGVEKTGRERPRAVDSKPVSLLEEYWVPVTATVATLLLLTPLLLRLRQRDRQSDRLPALADRPAELRRELETWLVRHGYHASRLKTQKSELAEAWRSVISLIDLVEREPWELERSRAELRRRVRDLIDEVR